MVGPWPCLPPVASWLGTGRVVSPGATLQVAVKAACLFSAGASFSLFAPLFLFVFRSCFLNVSLSRIYLGLVF